MLRVANKLDVSPNHLRPYRHNLSMSGLVQIYLQYAEILKVLVPVINWEGAEANMSITLFILDNKTRDPKH